MPETRESDLVLAPNEFAFVLDQNTGAIQPAVGPTKRTLENTERTVLFQQETGRFVETSASLAKQIFIKADERSYIILENPSNGDNRQHPIKGRDNPMPELSWGKKQNLPGPVMFPLWPGQIANVIKGHQLRSNQYLSCVVDNAQEAIQNWSQAIVDKVQSDETDEKKTTVDLRTGQILIIKGSEISYYIPPTGIRVVPDENSSYVRDAVTLERLEYCILLDENGNKRFEKGPSVVFPQPTETFIEIDNNRKFNAIELNDQMGLYIKVTADYKEDDKPFVAGDELFITGKEQKIYYPRPEHSIVKYGNKTRHYSVAIPKGEGRYTLDKIKGEITTVKGPAMFLPDPRKEVIVRRILSDNQVKLWFPNNTDALTYNQTLAQKAKGEKFYKDEDVSRTNVMFMNENQARGFKGISGFSGIPGSRNEESIYNDTSVVSDRMNRGNSFTPPRTITLDTKYEGAVVINVWPGFAIQVVNKTGEREIVIGPNVVVLDYDEDLERMNLSTGKPKTDHNLLQTVYLQVKNNRVSDVVEATTKDMVNIQIRTNYRLNFEGDPKLWFTVDNYVKFLTQNLRSIIRNEIKKHNIQEITDNIASIIRDLILQKPPKEGDPRPGRTFPENGMHVIDVEILSLEIGDEKIKLQLLTNQYATIENTIKIANSNQQLDLTKQIEANNIQKLDIEKTTQLTKLKQIKEITTQQRENEQSDVTKQKEIALLRDTIEQISLDRRTKESTAALNELTGKTNVDTESFERQMKAIQPQLIEAIITTSTHNLTKSYVENIPKSGGNIGLFLGQQLIDNICALVKGSPIEKSIRSLGTKPSTKED